MFQKKEHGAPPPGRIFTCSGGDVKRKWEGEPEGGKGQESCRSSNNKWKHVSRRKGEGTTSKLVQKRQGNQSEKTTGLGGRSVAPSRVKF